MLAWPLALRLPTSQALRRSASRRKRNAKGHTTSWIGYKLHVDTADGGIPIGCIMTSASTHDSQVAIPWEP